MQGILGRLTDDMKIEECGLRLAVRRKNHREYSMSVRCRGFHPQCFRFCKDPKLNCCWTIGANGEMMRR